MPYTEIPVETLGGRNAVFLAIVCRGVQPYLDYDEPIDGPRDQRIPRVLMMLRWDGEFGFPGGFVNKGETLREACVREAMEEIRFAVAADRLVPVCSHDDGTGFATHLYAVELDPGEFDAAEAGVRGAEHYKAEVCGVVTPNIERSPGGRGYDSVLRWPFRHNAREQLEALVERLGLLAA